MKFIYILLLSFAFIHTGIYAQGYDESISTGNVEVTKKRGAEHMIGLDFRHQESLQFHPDFHSIMNGTLELHSDGRNSMKRIIPIIRW